MSFVPPIRLNANRLRRSRILLMATVSMAIIGSYTGSRVVYTEAQGIPNSAAPITSTNAGQVKLLATYGHGYPQHMTWSPDGSQLAVSSTAGVWIYQAANDFAADPRLLPNVYGNVFWSPDGQTIAANGQSWTMPPGSFQAPFYQADTSGNFQAAFSAAGHTLIYKTVDNAAAIGDTASGLLLGTLGAGGTSTEAQLTSLSISPDGQWVAIARYNGSVELWLVAKYRKVATLTGQYHGNTPLAFSPDSKLLAVVGDQAVQWWPVPDAAHPDAADTNSHSVQKFPRLKGSTSIAFSADGKRFAANDISGNIEIIDTAHGSTQSTIVLNSSYAPFALSPDGTQLAVNLNGVSIWRIAASTQTRLSGFGYFQKAAFVVAKSTDTAARAVIFSKVQQSGEIVLRWNLADASVVPAFDPVVNGKYMATSPDGKLLAVAEANRPGWFDLVDVTTGFPLITLPIDRGTIEAMQFSANSQVLSATTSENHVLFWDIGDGHSLTAVRSLYALGTPFPFALSANANYAAFILSNPTDYADKSGKEIAVLDSQTGKVILTFPQIYEGLRLPTNQIVSLIPNSADKSIDFAPVYKPFSHILNGLLFSPDGKTLYIGSNTEITAVDIHSGGSNVINYGSSGQMILSPDGKTLIFADGHKALNLINHQLITLDVTASFNLNSSTFSPDGSLLAYEVCRLPEKSLNPPSRPTEKLDPREQPQIETGLLDLTTGKKLPTINLRPQLSDHGCVAAKNAATVSAAVAFNSDGSLLLTLGEDRILQVWGIPAASN